MKCDRDVRRYWERGGVIVVRLGIVSPVDLRKERWRWLREGGSEL